MVSAAPSDRNLFEEGSGATAPAFAGIRQAGQQASQRRLDHQLHGMERAQANPAKYERWP